MNSYSDKETYTNMGFVGAAFGGVALELDEVVEELVVGGGH